MGVGPVRVESASVFVGSTALLEEVTLEASEGEMVAIVGPNGAGKSTLLTAISGDRRVDEGRILLGGDPVETLDVDELSRLRAVLSQDLPARIPFPVWDLVEMGRHPHRRDPDASAERERAAVRDALAAVELVGWEDRIVATLSGGERMRAHLARVLAQETPIVLLDEPTASLDIAHQEHALRLCERLAGEGRTVVAVLHDLNAAARYADRVAILDRGRLRAAGPPSEVLDADLLSDVYRQPIRVIDHPLRDGPLVLVVDR